MTTLEEEQGCTCNISDHEDREHRPGCKFFNQELWDIVLKHRVQLLNADRNATLASEADSEATQSIKDLIAEQVQKAELNGRLSELERFWQARGTSGKSWEQIVELSKYHRERLKELQTLKGEQ